jgi:hypothetical protein
MHSTVRCPTSRAGKWRRNPASIASQHSASLSLRAFRWASALSNVSLGCWAIWARQLSGRCSRSTPTRRACSMASWCICSRCSGDTEIVEAR